MITHTVFPYSHYYYDQPKRAEEADVHTLVLSIKCLCSSSRSQNGPVEHVNHTWVVGAHSIALLTYFSYSVVYGFQILIQLGCKYLKAGALQYKITKSGAIPLIASEIGTDCVPYLNGRPMG